MSDSATEVASYARHDAARAAYRRIRNFLAGRLVGMTRDEVLVEEVLKCVFCRALTVRDGVDTPTDALQLAQFYRGQFARLKKLLPELFPASAEILLDPVSISYVDEELRQVDFEDVQSDPVGDAFEAFVSSSSRAAAGQFFTPQVAVEALVSLVNPQKGERVIDPACGAGGFLSFVARRLSEEGVPAEAIAESVLGVEKDEYLSRLAKAHVGIVTLRSSDIRCGDSLAWTPMIDGDQMPAEDGAYEIVLANPPFGAKIVAASPETQAEFSLGHKWKLSDGRWEQTDELLARVTPQVLFVERIIGLAKPGGKVGIVLPESLLSSKGTRHVVQYILDNTHVRAVIGMPESLFKTSGSGGTHTKVCLLMLERKSKKSASSPIFMAEATWCGNDSRGRAIPRNDVPEILRRFGQGPSGAAGEVSKLGYWVAPDAIEDNLLAPRYYNPMAASLLAGLESTHELVRVGDLVDQGVLKITTGHEVGKLEYGGGAIPFIRTSDISNWEIKRDPKHCVSAEVYDSLSSKQDVQAGDILMVRDGSYLIGTCALVTKHDTRIVYQSHLYKLRVLKPETISPHLLLAALSSEPVRKQIEAKRVTQDIIDSLGDRIHDLVLPLPRDPARRKAITATVKKSIDERVASRELARQAVVDVVAA